MKLAKGDYVPAQRMCRKRIVICRAGIKKKDSKLTGKVGIELSHCDFPSCGLLLQAIQFGMGSGGIGLGGNEQVLGFLQLALPLLLFLQKLRDPALQLFCLGLVTGISLVQLLGHIH
jgi:hypothetical protein